MTDHPLLTLPDNPGGPLSIRAKALLFHDPVSVALLQHIERLARSEATAMVIGETGTGKELVARHIHRISERRGPFVAVNCGAFSEALIDAELFGHEAGAYTGAAGARAGWFEAANGGTLFLDEIGDLSLPLQVKLLRVLQERQVVRLGSRKPIALDVRLVAATNIDLQQAVAAQRFRADLYYRLSVAPVQLPPLRDRPGDILPLAQHFLQRYAQRLQVPLPVRLSPAAERALLAYPWPGNIRELENVMHFALIVCSNSWIEPQDLKLCNAGMPAALPSPLPQAAATAPAPEPTEAPGLAGPGTAAVPAHATAPQARSEAGSEAGAEVAAVIGTEGARPLAAEPATTSTTPLPAATAASAPPAPGTEQQLAALFDTLLATRPARLQHTVEATLVRCAYAACGDNQVQAARLLGITRNSLRTLLKRHGLLAADLRADGAAGAPADGPDAPDGSNWPAEPDEPARSPAQSGTPGRWSLGYQ